MINIKTLLVVMVLSTSIFAQELVETGFLRNRVGQPLTKVVQMKFRIYEQPTGGTAIWDSGFVSVTVNEGLYTVKLGHSPQPPITETIFSTSGNYYMEYQAEADTFPSRELIAYQARSIMADKAIQSERATTADYALHVDWANINGRPVTFDVTGMDIVINTTNYALVAGTVITDSITTEKIQDGTIMNADIAIGAITSAKIEDLTITGLDIAAGAVSSTKIADAAVVNSKIVTIDASKVIGTFTNMDVSGDLKVSGKVVYQQSSIINIADPSVPINFTGSFIRVQGSGGAKNMIASPQIIAGTDGQQLIVMGTSDSNTVKLNNGNGLVLYGGVGFTLGNNDAIRFVYSGGNWFELSRSDN